MKMNMIMNKTFVVLFKNMMVILTIMMMITPMLVIMINDDHHQATDGRGEAEKGGG